MDEVKKTYYSPEKVAIKEIKKSPAKKRISVEATVSKVSIFFL